MNNLQSLVEGYRKPNRSRGVQRNELAYQQCFDFTKSELERLITEHHGVLVEDMRARLIRDSIDHHIRRYHEYCISGKIESHYREQGVIKGDSIFEHVIPLSSVRDMLLENRITITQALNTPTCLIKKSSDRILSSNGLTKSSPSNWNFFKRYAILNSNFSTYNGTSVSSPDNWTLEDHFKFFGII
jgi:hypothetical protein